MVCEPEVQKLCRIVHIVQNLFVTLFSLTISVYTDIDLFSFFSFAVSL